MDSPESIVSSLDPEDNEVHFCKKCSKILEEGRAYELGGNRWHVECFRCSSCDSLLDGDTNLLVLGNGSLICASCSYHCYGCGKKIDDLAILTGDQAFCSTCFCCRNCKKKIEDLRYARTSQGIFCMTCHETLLAKKRKQKAARREREREVLLPSTEGTVTPPLQRRGTNESIRTHRRHSKLPMARTNSPFRNKDLPQLPPKWDNNDINTNQEKGETQERGETRERIETREKSERRSINTPSKDIPLTLSLADLEVENPQTSEKRHSTMSNSTLPFMTPTSGSSDTMSSQLDEARSSVEKTTPAKESDKENSSPPITETKVEGSSIRSTRSTDSGITVTPRLSPSKSSEEDRSRPTGTNSKLAPPLSWQGEVPERSHRRGESPCPDNTRIHTPESSKLAAFSPLSPRHDAHTNSANRSQQIVLNDDEEIDAALYSSNNYEMPVPLTPQKRERLGSASSSHSKAGSVFQKNAATPKSNMLTPSRSSPWHRRSDSNGNNKSIRTPDISLPILQGSSAINFDSDLTSMISNPLSFNPHHSLPSPTASFGHQRSISDTNQSPRYQQKIPTSAGPTAVSEEAALRSELTAAQRRIAELERQLQSQGLAPEEADDDSKLTEKRKTIAVLQAQKEVARRELVSLKEAKGHDNPQSMIDEFTAQMATLKVQLQDEIASLSVTKETLILEVADLNRQKKEACEEMTILNVKNAQLTDLNNELTNNLIDKYHPTYGTAMKSTSGGTSNIFGFKKDHHNKGATPPVAAASPAAGDGLSNIGSLIVQAYQPDDPNIPAGTPAVTNLDDNEDPAVTVLEVVDTKRDRQTARRFWKRPKAAVTKGAVKGFNKVFDQPYGSEPPAVTNLEPSALAQPSNEANGLNISFPKSSKSRNNWFKTSAGGAAQPPEGDSGSLLKMSITQRCQMEGNKVPVIVTKCIEEVEKRGMLQEGIYRKSGARTQIEQIEARFERYDENANYEDILSGDVNGVASALKQYLRYLPDPLISSSCYNAFIQVSSQSQDTETRLESMRQLLQKLPTTHCLCLERLCRHLNKVTKYAETNLMSSKNLAMVFAPTLARSSTGEREIADMHHKSDSTLFMIEHFNELF